MSPTYTVGGKGGKKITLQESHDRIIVRTKNAGKLTIPSIPPIQRRSLRNSR